jgi:eukaryotic-like serine/threonine-protein kinase
MPYIGSTDQNIYALNAATGAFLWKYTTGGFIGSSPAVANGTVYVGSYDTYMYAFDKSSGTSSVQAPGRH